MRKIFKYQYGTGGGGGIPWQTSNSGANSSIIMTSSPTKLPNYKTQAQVSNIQTANTYTPKLSSSQIGGMIKNPSVNPLYTPPKPVTIDGITDLNPGNSTQISEGATGISKSAKVGNTLSQVAGIVSSLIPQTPQSDVTSALDTGFGAATGMVSMASPLAGGIMAGVGAATDVARLFGLGTDQVTTEDKILDSKFLALTPLGLANSLGAKRGQTLNKGLDYDKIKADMGAGYGGVMDQLAISEKYAGKKMGNLFGQRDRANKKVYEGNYQLAKMEKIWDKRRINEAIQGTQSDMAFNKENLRMQGGWQDGAISFGRRGMIIEPARLRMIRHIAQSYKPQVYTETELSEEEIIQFKNGGSFNVIPEGSLHARLHHMENADGLTKKGIPVVAEKDGGELEQQAEIELNEIIFRLEVTNEIEKLMEDGSDNAAIECGKMLVKEIFENTQDRTGLIESLEEPKEDQRNVVKEHRVFQKGGKAYPHWSKPKDWTEEKIPYKEWIKDLNPNEYNGNYDLETAYKYYPKEDLERWKWAATRPTEDEYNYYMDYQDKDGRYIYHLGSIAPIPGTEDFIFLKKGREENNPELHFETDGYWNGENGLRDTHDLRYEGDRYYYRKRRKKK